MSFKSLNQQVSTLFNSHLEQTLLDELALSLYLLDSKTELASFDSHKIEEIWSNMPYWAFVWSSGYALASYVLQNPALVKGKCIADFGAGSGLVALAALKAGASRAIAIDLDQQSLRACQLNAGLNGLEITVADGIDKANEAELLLVGDVLYDPRNHDLAHDLFQQERALIWAESRAQTRLAKYTPQARLEGRTVPNLGGFDEHKDIFIYHHQVT
ncbi:methyltransferase [Bermanella marisrubri]|uniref:Methyltransferase n=1 Tax=Bermanella marisrubri TaxID=207949 RepID=Q1N2P9_9GAMM|nr:50S ribosomal protein L11 methyltransferase [Bermanella marisrubri]EAT12620.1 hypothetical protein RED65_06983 [Oceanobacter sp. RED65] [Bermanella marisrubri]QIZ84829.1 methyltransferase [Bermanella marisrubri]